MPGGGFVSSSKLLQKKWEERAYQMHRQKMMSMKSDLPEYKSPKSQSFPHLVLRVKKVQKEEERQAQIDYENQLLIQKMTRIMRSRGSLDNWNDYQPRSLNIYKREKEQERIAEENLDFARRLVHVKPKYDVRDWEEEYQRHSYYLNMWASSTKDYSPLPQRKSIKAGSQWRSDSKSSVDNSQEGYESDFEPDEESNSDHEKLPSINSRQSTNREGKHQKKKDSKVTRLPNINKKKTENKKRYKSKDSGRSEKNPVADSDAHLLFKATNKMANVDDVIQKTLIKKSYAQRMATKRRFEELYSSSLEEELKELGKDYEVLVECLLAERESRDAEAVNTLIHDNDVSSLINLFCSRNQSALNSINSSYQEKYDVSIKEDIEHRILSDDCQGLLVALLDSSKSNKEVNEEKAEKDAKALFEAGQGRFTERDGKLLSLIQTSSLAQVKTIFNKYKSVSGGEDIAQSMKNENCSKEYITAVETMVKCMSNGAALNAEAIHSLIKKGKKKELIHLLMARAEIDMPEVTKAYKKKYGTELSSDILAKYHRPLGPLIIQITSKQAKSDQSKGSKSQRQSKGQGKPQEKQTGTKSNTETQQNKQTEQKKDKEKNDNEPDRKKGNKSGKSTEVDRRKDSKGSRDGEADKRKGSRSSRNSEKKKEGSVKESTNFNPESDAEKIHEAVKGFGTDEQPLIDILAHRTNEQRQEIKKKYKEKYDKDLLEVMKSELTGDFEEVTLALLMTPKAYDVYCLHDAIHGPGTREAALIGILCTRSNKEIKAIKDEYKETYDNELEDDLRGDTSGDFEELLIELSKGEREQGEAVDHQKAEQDAQSLHEVGDLAEASNLFWDILCKKNKAQIKATFEKYQEISGKTIEEAIKNASWKNKNDSVDGYTSLAEAIQDTVYFYAKRLQDAVKGLGTNDKQLIRIVVSRSQTDLADIAAKFKELTGKSFASTIEDETSGDYKRMLLAIVKDS